MVGRRYNEEYQAILTKEGNRKQLKGAKKESLLKNANAKIYSTENKLIRQEHNKIYRQEQANIYQDRWRANNPSPQEKNRTTYTYSISKVNLAMPILPYTLKRRM